MLAVSDAGCAALFCKAALQASALNVAINTKLMTDRAHAAALDEKAARMLAEYVPLADVDVLQVGAPMTSPTRKASWPAVRKWASR